MKNKITILCLFCPILAISQVQLKGGFTASNRWDETLNAQTLGKGFRIAAEKQVAPKFAIGIETAYLSFHPTDLVAVKFNTLSLIFTYYFSENRLRPYLGTGAGFVKYSDKTTIELGAGNNKTQTRNKNYGDVSPFLGLQYYTNKHKNKLGIFLQINADFIPVVNIPPIGFLSVTGGLLYQFHQQ